MQQIETTLRSASEYLFQSRIGDHEKRSTAVMSARLEQAQQHAATLLRCLSDLCRLHSSVAEERDRLQGELQRAQRALVRAALCDDPARSRDIAERYIKTLAPETVAEVVVSDARTRRALRLVSRDQ